MGKPSNYDRTAGREFTVLWRANDSNGRSEVKIRCPFCAVAFTARIWSISGGGKRCPNCGAKHGSTGWAYPLVGYLTGGVK